MKDLSRLKRFPISGEILFDIFRTGRELHLKVDNGFPLDAAAVRHYYDRTTGMYYVVVYSETFEPVEEGSEIPFSIITVTTLVQQNPAEQKENEVEKGAKEAISETEANVRADA